MSHKKRTYLVAALGLLVLLAVAIFAPDLLKGTDHSGEATSSRVSVSSGTILSSSKDMSSSGDTSSAQTVTYKFRNQSLLSQHYDKHGIHMGFASAEAYEAAAGRVINDPAALHKTEAEDGDDIYYIESTNEFVVLSGDGYIRTYFLPDDGIDYYNRQ